MSALRSFFFAAPQSDRQGGRQLRPLPSGQALKGPTLPAEQQSKGSACLAAT